MKALLLLALISTTAYTLLDTPVTHVAKHALEQPKFLSLLLSGTAQEKHRFAHGQWTKYGSLPFDSDLYLRSRGYSETKLHRVGYAFGFSKLRER